MQEASDRILEQGSSRGVTFRGGLLEPERARVYIELPGHQRHGVRCSLRNKGPVCLLVRESWQSADDGKEAQINM